MVIEATQLDRAGPCVTVNHHLHDGRGHAYVTVSVVFGLRENARGANDHRVDVRIERLLGITVAVGQIGRPHVATLHQILGHQVCRGVAEHRRLVELLLADALHRLEHQRRIALRQEPHQLAGIDEPGHVRGLVHLGGTRGGIHHVGRGHGIAAGIGGVGADQRQQVATRAGRIDAVHRIERVI